IEIRDQKFAHVSPDASRLGVPGQNLNGVVPWKQRIPGVVLDRLLRQLRRRLAAELDIHFVANILDRSAVLILDLAANIHHRPLAAAAAREGSLAPWILHPTGQLLSRAIQLEIFHLDWDAKTAKRTAQHRGLPKLPLLARGGELFNLLSPKLPPPVIKLRA